MEGGRSPLPIANKSRPVGNVYDALSSAYCQGKESSGALNATLAENQKGIFLAGSLEIPFSASQSASVLSGQ
jgi:hypothetical protein